MKILLCNILNWVTVFTKYFGENFVNQTHPKTSGLNDTTILVDINYFRGIIRALQYLTLTGLDLS